MRRYIPTILGRVASATVLFYLLLPLWSRLHLAESWLVVVVVLAANYILPPLARRFRRREP